MALGLLTTTPFPLPSPPPGPAVDDAMETSQQAVADSSTSVAQELVVELHGHQSEVLTCQWSPTEDILASG